MESRELLDKKGESRGPKVRSVVFVLFIRITPFGVGCLECTRFHFSGKLRQMADAGIVCAERWFLLNLTCISV